MQLRRFEYDGYDIVYPRFHFQFIKEVFFLDVYRTNLLKENDIVLDLGASTGDFCIIASRKVGNSGRVIAVEPDIENYKLLKSNIERNNCKNILPVNIAVGTDDNTEKEIIAPLDKRCLSRTRTISSILQQLQIYQQINFIKMDIEGTESCVVAESIKIFKEASVISLEFHGTKEKVDEILLRHGFSFIPITMKHIYKKVIKNLFLHPITLYNVYRDTIINNPHILSKAITGLDMTKGQLLAGSYVKGR
jgi:FkbM family methyltransferase